MQKPQSVFMGWVSIRKGSFLVNIGVNLHVCLFGGRQVASAQTLDFLKLGQIEIHPAGVGVSTERRGGTGTRLEAVGLSTHGVFGMGAAAPGCLQTQANSRPMV
ncbi:hypothetical protein TRIP_B50204 [uncultured Desulfatiglans sp.]|nr:hypothetical protein TRIP_B50204 [uncultured Desulfatiglans sp.]